MEGQPIYQKSKEDTYKPGEVTTRQMTDEERFTYGPGNGIKFSEFQETLHTGKLKQYIKKHGLTDEQVRELKGVANNKKQNDEHFTSNPKLKDQEQEIEIIPVGLLRCC